MERHSATCGTCAWKRPNLVRPLVDTSDWTCALYRMHTGIYFGHDCGLAKRMSVDDKGIRASVIVLGLNLQLAWVESAPRVAVRWASQIGTEF